jgi:hypothetical protein
MDDHIPESLWNRACLNTPEAKPCEQSRDDVCSLCEEKIAALKCDKVREVFLLTDELQPLHARRAYRYLDAQYRQEPPIRWRWRRAVAWLRRFFYWPPKDQRRKWLRWLP